jgi:hypothetical protein
MEDKEMIDRYPEKKNRDIGREGKAKIASAGGGDSRRRNII